jgi:hypothetical protein
MKDLEDPYYNQALYVPTLATIYMMDCHLHNKTILDKPYLRH